MIEIPAARAVAPLATVAPSTSATHRAARFERVVALVTILVPLAAVLAAFAVFLGRGLSLLDLALVLGMYTVSLMGITLGYHRLFTHRSFQTVRPLRWALAIAGAMAAQGPVLFWVACHRKHHRCSDGPGDPHSPHDHAVHAGDWRGVLAGCWHAHVGWMLKHEPENYFRLAPDLLRDRGLMFINRWYFAWVALGIVLPGVIGGAWTGTWTGFLTGTLWAGLVRLFLVHHSTWSINSICHLFGGSPYDTGDESRNNAVCALLTFGEGWHNNHHAFPTSARHGLRWWQFDPTYETIRLLRLLRLAWDVRLPETTQAARRLRPAPAALAIADGGAPGSFPATCLVRSGAPGPARFP